MHIYAYTHVCIHRADFDVLLDLETWDLGPSSGISMDLGPIIPRAEEFKTSGFKIEK